MALQAQPSHNRKSCLFGRQLIVRAAENPKIRDLIRSAKGDRHTMLQLEKVRGFTSLTQRRDVFASMFCVSELNNLAADDQSADQMNLLIDVVAL